MFLTKEQILAAPDLASEVVPVPEWNGEVIVRALSEAERQTLLADYDEKALDTRAKLCALAIVDEAGKPLFSPADVQALQGKNAAAIDRVFEVAKRLGGLGKGEIEEAKKNSASTTTAASPSA